MNPSLLHEERVDLFIVRHRIPALDGEGNSFRGCTCDPSPALISSLSAWSWSAVRQIMIPICLGVGCVDT